MIKDKLFPEIFEEFSQAQTKGDRIAVLKRYDNQIFRNFIFYAFSAKVKFDVEIPEYRPAPEPAGLNYTYLSMELDKLYRFIKDHPRRPKELTPQKQKQLLAVILESLHKDEAEMLVQIMKRKFEVKFLTPSLIQEVFPGLLK
jgi:hypothetical protein